MEYYRPVGVGRRKQDDASGSQHLLEGDQEKFICFRCERSKPECNSARNCNFNKKKNGSTVNSLEIIAAKIQDMKADKQRREASGHMGGSQHAI